jgi:NAD+ synthase (glutamine-hydrolysing)
MSKNINILGYCRIISVAPKLKIADPDFNTSVMREFITKIENLSPHFILFPELSVTAYTCADLFFSERLSKLTMQSIAKLKDFSTKFSTVFIIGAPLSSNGKLFNCAIVIQSGKILGIVPKSYICNSAEYYEERWFSSEFDRVSDTIIIENEAIPFGADLIFESFDGKLRFGIEICEDLWAVAPPSNDLALAGAEILFNLSASNEYLGKYKYRKDLVQNHSAKTISAYVYSSCGPWESTSDTLFSGNCIIAENGKILTETKRFSFESEYCIADVDLQMLRHDRQRNNSFGGSQPSINFRTINFDWQECDAETILRHYSPTPFVPEFESERSSVCDEILQIQSTALARRLLQIKSKAVIIGLSGGLDSTLALIATAMAFDKIELDRKGIIAITMPGMGTSEATKSNAIKLAESFGCTLKIIDIKASVMQHFQDISHDANVHDVTFENAQARQRTMILMDMANKMNGIVIGTGDLSEIALGWNTFNADHMSMYNVNSGIPKTLVKYIIDWYANSSINNSLQIVLKDIIDTPISPELLPLGEGNTFSQETEKIIGPYVLHDFFIYYTVRFGFDKSKIMTIAETAFSSLFSSEEIEQWYLVFFDRFYKNQFKRNVVPDGIKIGSVNLSPRADWRMPSDAL